MKNIKAKQETTVSVCTGTGGVAAGGYKVLEAFQNALDEKGVKAKLHTRCRKVGCRGFCAKDVLVDVAVNGHVSTYQFVKPEMVPKIIDEHIVTGNPIDEWLVGDEYVEFHNNQQKLILENCGRIDPESIDDYMAVGGYNAAEKALAMEPEAVIDIIKKSGLRGRGGAGFPTGIKWESCRKAEGNIKYVLCNADEGDPGAFMDRSVIEGNPHSLIEGMIIGAYAIGSIEGYVYIRAEYPLAVERLRIALDQARKKKFLGENIFRKNITFDIKIFLGAGAFVCGEATALMTSIEDKAGEPRPKYVHTTDRGLWGCPSNLNNVETWANVPVIIKNGAEWYRKIGSEGSKGTKIFSLVGNINNTGLVEVPMGIPLRKIIYDIGGGIPNKKQLKAVQTGGPSGGCIPANLMNLPVDFENLFKVGSIMGSGGMIVMDEDTCMVDVAKYFISFCLEESCGQCTPCREGLHVMERILTDITEGRGKEEHLQQLMDLSEIIVDTSLCGLGKSAPNPVVSTLRYFKDEYIAHIMDKHCPAGRCSQLTPAPCHMTCPAGIDVPSYVAYIAHGRHEDAVKVIMKDNPLPWVCGLICPAPCEGMCRRGDVDQPISIRALKGFASKYVMEKFGGYEPWIKTRRDEKVAVIGSGPAGLSAAYYLALEGYNITVFEALPEPGGMLRVGIPPHRLPKDLLNKEVENFIKMGIKIKTHTALGTDFTLDDLFEQGFSAVFLGIGAHKPISLGLTQEDTDGVIQGVDYLKRLNLEEPVPKGKFVAVIGGGNVAIDVARVAVRKGAKQVTILYRRTQREMPAYDSEIEEALEEGVKISYLTAPESILTQNGHVVGLKCIKMKLGDPDASGRRRPIPIKGSEYELESDLVIPSIGQTMEIPAKESIKGVDIVKWGSIKVDAVTLATTRPGVYAGGDAVSGTATVIEAIAGGKKAAIAIDAYIKGIEDPKFPPVPQKKAEVEKIDVSEEKMAQLKRPKIPLLGIEKRVCTFDQVELGLSEKAARDEAKRCLRCDLN
jgi:NADH-quinone oxidoreductase subunit F